MFFDHKNIDYAERVLGTRRNWIADIQHILANVVRVWIDGKNNVLADSGSRAPWHVAVAKHLPVPLQPMKDVIHMFFLTPSVLCEAIDARKREMKAPELHPHPNLLDVPPAKSPVQPEAVAAPVRKSGADAVPIPAAEVDYAPDSTSGS